jgi:hypothetical protein
VSRTNLARAAAAELGVGVSELSQFVRNHPTPTTEALEAFGNADAPDQEVLEAYLARVREA